nr:hypothetical protein [Tanacetum cinerariifolium]
MKILAERKLLPGLTKVSLQHCVISKQHRLKFKTSNSRSVYVLELVHSDKKSDVFEVFKVYKAQVELDSGKKIKCLRTDNGGEYTGDEFDTFYRQEGIKSLVKDTNEDVDGLAGDRTTRETTSIQMEKEFQSNDSFKVAPQHEEGEPSTLQEALNNPDALFWKEALQEEIKALHKNKTWELVPLPGEELDVRTAFLHENLEEEIYMLQPKDFKQKGKENLVCKLNKSLYDLKQVPRYDMLVAGPNKDRINKLKAQLAREFKMKDLEPVNKILGMQIHRDRVSRKIWLLQNSYVKKILQMFNMQDYKPISTPFPTNVKLSSKMSPSNEKERMKMSRVLYTSAVGSLMFTMIYTRPDIAHAVGVGYVDSDYACDLDRIKSTTGYVFTLCGEIYHFVHEKVEEGTVDMQKIRTDDNVTDHQSTVTSLYGVDPHAAKRKSNGACTLPASHPILKTHSVLFSPSSSEVIRELVGDETTTVVLLAGELLREAKPFIEDVVHPQNLI